MDVERPAKTGAGIDHPGSRDVDAGAIERCLKWRRPDPGRTHRADMAGRLYDTAARRAEGDAEREPAGRRDIANVDLEAIVDAARRPWRRAFDHNLSAGNAQAVDRQGEAGRRRRRRRR